MPRKQLSISDFTRPQKHLSDRLIILSCEGFVTEEKYSISYQRIFFPASNQKLESFL